MHLVGIARKNSKGRFLNFFCEPLMKIQKTRLYPVCNLEIPEISDFRPY